MLSKYNLVLRLIEGSRAVLSIKPLLCLPSLRRKYLYMYRYHDADCLLPLSLVALLLLLAPALMAYNSLCHSATGPLKAPRQTAPTGPSRKELQPGNLELADQFPEFCLQAQRHLDIDAKVAASTRQLRLQLQVQRPVTPPDLWTPPRSPVSPVSPAANLSGTISEAEAEPLPFAGRLQRGPSPLLPRPRCISDPPQRSGRDKEHSGIAATRLQRSEKRSSSLGTKALSQSPTHSKLSSPPTPPPKPAKFSRQPRPAESQRSESPEAASDLALIESKAPAADVLVDSSSIRGVHDQFLTRMTFSDQQRWITVQEKTFTKWCVPTCSNQSKIPKCFFVSKAP